MIWKGIFFLSLVCIGCNNATLPAWSQGGMEAARPISQLEPEMVRIPAGYFLMGSDLLGEAEKPVHRVYLDEYYIGKFEVTNAQYKAFCDATGYVYPGAEWYPDAIQNGEAEFRLKPNHPVVAVNWNDAVAYCQWLSKVTGKKYRLPTEAEWEKAARGGLEGRMYPWGDEAVDAGGCYRANVGSESDNDRIRKRDGFLYTSPVGSFLPNGYGLYDMAGNAWEWCQDRYDEHYYQWSPEVNPKGPDTGERRVLRGGSWWGGPRRLPCAARHWNYPLIRYASTGFRVAMTP
ncbi:MAG: formylglycine-generating enzyme family protein [Acidobacteriota bacterium]|nr:formylglycine-generating enzyme family protein [Blastocatellia bacterium]MDW8238270.1 formylglycine-generating enzyme family protein [Acidobacteriota bacterium]